MAVFLMQDGVLSMGNKTPVTILQETLHRKGMNPQYDLLFNGVGTDDPIFKYQVSALGFSAIGDGKSKKEAKHDAAASLLKKMHQGVDFSGVKRDPDITSPYSGAIKQNFVGMLEEICVVNKIPLPVFEPVCEDGPPHARIFTVQCKVSGCLETAAARTKKQAKHLVAQQMITKITDVMGDMFIPLREEKSAAAEDQVDVTIVSAIQAGTYRHDLAIPIAEFHNVFFNRVEEYLIPKEFLQLSKEPEQYYENLKTSKELLEAIVKGLEGIIKITPISKQSLQQALQEIEKDCSNLYWVDEGDLEDYTDEFQYENFNSSNIDVDDNCFNDSDSRYILEEFDLGKSNDSTTGQVNENFDLGEDNASATGDEEKCSNEDNVLEENNDSVGEDKKCSNEEFVLEENNDSVTDEDKKCSGEEFVLEENNDSATDKEKKYSNEEFVLEVNNDSTTNEQKNFFNGEFDIRENNNSTYVDENINKCIDQFKTKLNINLPLDNPVLLYLLLECPQGKWVFYGQGDSEAKAERMAIVMALKFLRLMSFPNSKIENEKKE